MHAVYVSGSRILALVFAVNHVANITCRSRKAPIGRQLLIIRQQVVGIELLCFLPAQRVDAEGVYALWRKVGGMTLAFAVEVGKNVIETSLEIQSLDDFVLGHHHSRKPILTLYARMHVHQPIGVVLAVLHISPILHGAFELYVMHIAFIHTAYVFVGLVIRLF